MTTPFERYRALARFPQMLTLATSDELLPTELQVRASQLLGEFPDERTLCALVDSGRQGLPPDVLQSLDDAAGWLQDLGKVPSLSVEMGQWHRWTTRHFPDRSSLECQRPDQVPMPKCLRTSINEWINPNS